MIVETINLCKQHDLEICNTFFEHKNMHRYIWEKPSLSQKSIIDYIIIRQKTAFKI